MAQLYLCNRKACEVCNEDCSYTFDIRHAVSFIKKAMIMSK